MILTHLHVDHAGGLVRDGKAVYPNAQIVVADAEAAFWLDEAIEAKAPDDAKPFFAIAQASLAPYGDRVTRLSQGTAEAAPGFEVTPLPGHTPGHTGYVIGQGTDRLWLWGDIVHAAALQFPRPEATIAFDTDRAAAAASRGLAFDRAANERLLVAGVHLPSRAWATSPAARTGRATGSCRRPGCRSDRSVGRAEHVSGRTHCVELLPPPAGPAPARPA